MLAYEGRELLAAARKDLGRTVPTCPDWTVRDLLAHTGQMHRLWAGLVAGRLQERPRELPQPPSDDAELPAWYEQGLDRLGEVLAGADPAEPVWSWHRANRTAGFWRRRLAHETTVHRVDAQSASGTPEAVATDVAMDGADEVLEAILVAFSRRDVGGDGRTIELATGDRGWRVTPHQDHIDLERDVGSGEAAAYVHGAPAELYLWLWGRGPDGSVQLGGNTELARFPRERIAQLTG